jgi:hypothetical protein
VGLKTTKLFATGWRRLVIPMRLQAFDFFLFEQGSPGNCPEGEEKIPKNYNVCKLLMGNALSCAGTKSRLTGSG